MTSPKLSVHGDSERRVRQRLNVWRTTLILGLIALAFFASAFFMLVVK